MNKAEAIRKTEYNEAQLISLALLYAATDMITYRDEARDADLYDHYDNLRRAFLLMYDEQMNH